MNTNNVLLGMFVGVITVSMFTPILTVYGFNQTTSLILLYTLPLVGAASIVVTDSLEPDGNERPKERTSEKSLKKNSNYLSGLLGKHIVLHTKMGGSYKGHVKGLDSEMIILDDAVRLDIPDGNILDHLFIEKKDIKRIETSAIGNEITKNELLVS